MDLPRADARGIREKRFQLDAQNCTVQVAHHPAGIMAKCLSCNGLLDGGTYVVQVTIDHHTYLVGHNPPKTCCGKEKSVARLFGSEDEAMALATAVLERITLDGDTRNVKLLNTARFGSVAKN